MSKASERKQQEIYEFIKSEILHKGYAPTIREIGRAVSLRSPSSVHAHLNALESRGFITRNSSKSRTIVIKDESSAVARAVSVPVIGGIAAGQPILAIENIEGYIPLPYTIFKEEVFALIVHGESMINAGIMDGDYVIIKPQQTAENGDIVAAVIDDSVTLKRFYKEKNYFRLQPENDAMEPILTKDVSIVGIMKGLFRVY